jgi:hypothetical protein
MFFASHFLDIPQLLPPFFLAPGTINQQFGRKLLEKVGENWNESSAGPMGCQEGDVIETKEFNS